VVGTNLRSVSSDNRTRFIMDILGDGMADGNTLSVDSFDYGRSNGSVSLDDGGGSVRANQRSSRVPAGGCGYGQKSRKHHL